MKITKRDISVILYILTIVMVFVAYKMYYKPKIEEARTLEARNVELQEEIKVLQQQTANKVMYENTTEVMVEYVDAELVHYPATLTEQDLIMYADELNKKVGIDTDYVAFSSATPIYSIVGTGSVSDYNMTVNSYTVNVDYNTDYDGLKRIFNYIYSDELFKRVDSISFSINQKTQDEIDGYTDEEGLEHEPSPVTIYGSMQIELFQIDGKPEPEEYEDPYNSDTIEHGVDDVFKTVVEA
ncbi:MAG: hypothetical protein K6F92_07125, partial [Lachnospiraceae bacterium]|nr:hypothetical protein [Lachnospiraceae bacterium]